MAKEDTAQAPNYARATDYVKGIGVNLDGYQGRDLLLRHFTITQRPMRGKDSAFVSLSLSEIEDDGSASSEVVEAHAWSQSLADKLAEVPDSALPVVVNFVKVSTSGGFKVWSIA